MDPATLARDLVLILGPVLPFLIGVGQGAAGRVVGEAVLVTAKKLWGKLRPSVENKPAANEAVLDVAADPDDEDAQAALRRQLKKLLVDDTDLANELATIIADARIADDIVIAGGDRGIAVGRDMTNNTAITGDNNNVQRGKYNVKIDKARGLAIGDDAQVVSQTDQDDD